MCGIFDIDGDGLDIGYVNIKAEIAAPKREMRDLIESLWAEYELYADSDFCEGFAQDVVVAFGKCCWASLCCILDANFFFGRSAARTVGNQTCALSKKVDARGSKRSLQQRAKRAAIKYPTFFQSIKEVG